MCATGEKHRLKNITIHSAVAYLDTFFDKFYQTGNRMSSEMLHIYGCSALLSAGKIEEVEEDPPLARDIVYRVDIRQLKFAEQQLLNELSWKLSLVTPMHFIDFFMA